MYMNILNKTDKYFFISLITLILALVVPVMLICAFISLSFKFGFEAPIMFGILFILCALTYILGIPILLITQIITLVIKIFSKNKSIKDWIIILFNLISILIFGWIMLCLIGAAIVL